MAAITAAATTDTDPELVRTACKSLNVLTSGSGRACPETAQQIGSETDGFRTLVDLAAGHPRKATWVPAILTVANLAYRC